MSSLIYPALLIIAFFIPLNEGITYVGALLLLIAFLGGAIKPRRTVLDIPIIILLASLGLSTVFSVNPLLSLQALGIFAISMLAFYYFPVWTDISHEKNRWIFLTIAVACILVSFLGILQLFFGPNLLSLYHTGPHYCGRNLRIFSTLFDPDVLSEYLIFILPLTITLFLAGRDFRERLIGILAFSVGTPCVYLTYSRAGWFGFLVSFISLSLLLKKKRLLLILLAFLILGFFIFPSFFSKRLLHSLSLSDLLSAEPRTLVWREAVKLLLERPIFGFGLFTFDEAVIARSSLSTAYPPNLFLTFLFETGILGLLGFVYLLVVICRNALKCIMDYRDRFETRIAAGIMAGLFGYIATEQFHASLRIANMRILFFFLIGMLVKIVQSLREKTEISG